MAEKFWRGDAPAVAQVQTVTVGGTYAFGDTITLTINGKDIVHTVPSGGTALSAISAALQTALDASTITEFTEFSVTDDGVDTITLTANDSGVPFTLTVAKSSASGTVTTSVDTAATGPNHWDNADNWSPSGVPVNSDDVYFEAGDSDCLYGLDQSAVTLASLNFGMGYSGRVGLPRLNASGYVEYRDRSLAIGATTLLIGYGPGSGAGRIDLDTGAVQTAIEIRNTGGSTDSNVPTVRWKGTHASNALEMLGGSFGAAIYSDETATLATATIRGGTARLDNCDLSALYAFGANVSAHGSTLGGDPLEL